MKRKILTATSTVLVVASLAMVISRHPPEKPMPTKPASVVKSDGMTLTTATDPTLVFQKAFWRRPTRDDKILHAERREWSTSETGVRKWQWFIAVSPGPQLLDWLQTNPFALAATRAAGKPERQPDWFPKPSGDFQVQQNTEGHFILMLSADRKHLYATDCGSGFALPDEVP